MTRRLGMVELATAAGVSVATVDRVLNGREAVRPATIARIVEAAARIGHPAAARIAPALPAPPDLRFGLLLHKSGQEFYRRFAREMELAVSGCRAAHGRLIVDFASSQAPSEVARLIRAMADKCDVLAATAVSHPEISAAVDHLRGRGVPVIALLSDFAPALRSSYVGLDNLKVGRAAGWITAINAKNKGKVAIFVGGHRWHGHELRASGCRNFLLEQGQGWQPMETVVNLETRQLTYETTLGLLDRHPDLQGIYVAGGGMEGAIAALRAKRAAGEVALVVNELTTESRAALADGYVAMVMATPLTLLSQTVVDLMLRAKVKGASLPLGDHVFSPDLHVRETI